MSVMGLRLGLAAALCMLAFGLSCGGSDDDRSGRGASVADDDADDDIDFGADDDGGDGDDDSGETPGAFARVAAWTPAGGRVFALNGDVWGEELLETVDAPAGVEAARWTIRQFTGSDTLAIATAMATDDKAAEPRDAIVFFDDGMWRFASLPDSIRAVSWIATIEDRTWVDAFDADDVQVYLVRKGDAFSPLALPDGIDEAEAHPIAFGPGGQAWRGANDAESGIGLVLNAGEAAWIAQDLPDIAPPFSITGVYVPYDNEIWATGRAGGDGPYFTLTRRGGVWTRDDLPAEIDAVDSLAWDENDGGAWALARAGGELKPFRHDGGWTPVNAPAGDPPIARYSFYVADEARLAGGRSDDGAAFDVFAARHEGSAFVSLSMPDVTHTNPRFFILEDGTPWIVGPRAGDARLAVVEVGADAGSLVPVPVVDDVDGEVDLIEPGDGSPWLFGRVDDGVTSPEAFAVARRDGGWTRIELPRQAATPCDRVRGITFDGDGAAWLYGTMAGGAPFALREGGGGFSHQLTDVDVPPPGGSAPLTLAFPGGGRGFLWSTPGTEPSYPGFLLWLDDGAWTEPDLGLSGEAFITAVAFGFAF
ncbi:hypothetical protein K8I61_08145 [bacterium]|nr:hypothetical protein [bacterium]